MASRAREGCQSVRQTVLFLILLQKMGPLGTFLVASRKHRPHHSIHLYTPRPDYISQKTTSHSHHSQKQSLSLRHNKALACIPPARSWLLLRLMASRAREGCQPVRQTVLFLVLLRKMSPTDTFLVASRKHRSYSRSLQAPPVPARVSLS